MFVSTVSWGHKWHPFGGRARIMLLHILLTYTDNKVIQMLSIDYAYYNII